MTSIHSPIEGRPATAFPVAVAAASRCLAPPPSSTVGLSMVRWELNYFHLPLP